MKRIYFLKYELGVHEYDVECDKHDFNAVLKELESEFVITKIDSASRSISWYHITNYHGDLQEIGYTVDLDID